MTRFDCNASSYELDPNKYTEDTRIKDPDLQSFASENRCVFTKIGRTCLVVKILSPTAPDISYEPGWNCYIVDSNSDRSKESRDRFLPQSVLLNNLWEPIVKDQDGAGTKSKKSRKSRKSKKSRKSRKSRKHRRR